MTATCLTTAWESPTWSSRPTPGVSDLQPEDFARGRRTFLRKIKKRRPQTIAAVGLMVFREMVQTRRALQCGLQDEKIEGIPVFVVPNPSGRNAHFTYQEMLRHFVSLREWSRKKVTGSFFRLTLRTS